MILNKYYNEEFSESTSKFITKNNNPRSKKGLFLDRDGVLIKDVHHIKSPKEVELCKNVENFLRKARNKGFELIVVTNQSSISRSIISYEEYKIITDKFLSLIDNDLYPDLILSSFHLPKNENKLENFNWRKPGPGMINYALNLQKYEKSESALIGDKLTDLMAGNRAGLSNIAYIKSDLHKDESKLIKSWSLNNEIQYRELEKLEDFFV
tara:strand:+ start:1722 stop:2351 length:630 start_codon:yes stop_codon:yes gene_type:complete